MNPSFVKRKNIKAVYAGMHRLNSQWKKTAWKVKPFIDEGLFRSMQFLVMNMHTIAVFSRLYGWNTPYPEVCVDFINMFHADNPDIEEYDYSLYPDEYIMDLMEVVLLYISRMRKERNTAVLNKLEKISQNIINRIYRYRGALELSRKMKCRK